jgi:hypothetical protein
VLLILVALLPGCVVAVGNTGTTTTVVTNMKGQAQRTVEAALPLSAGDTLVLVSSFGDVTVRSAGGAPVVVGEISLTAATQEAAERAILAFGLSTKRTARGLEVIVVGDAGTYEIEGGQSVPYSPTVSFTAAVPAGVSVIAESSSGEIEVTGPLAGCHAVTSFGDIDVEDVAGTVYAATSSGEVEATGVAQAAAHLATSFGDIEAEGTFTSLSAKTSSGEVEVRVRPGSRVTGTWLLETSFGDVTLYLPQGAAGHILAQTSFGEVSSELGMASSAKSEGATSLELNLGAGDGTIKLLTSSGDIEIKRN